MNVTANVTLQLIKGKSITVLRNNVSMYSSITTTEFSCHLRQLESAAGMI